MKKYVLFACIAAIVATGLSGIIVPTPKASAEGECKIKVMGFGSQGGFYGKDISGDEGSLAGFGLSGNDIINAGLKVGDKNNNFIKKNGNDITQTPVTLSISTENCIGKKLKLRIMSTNPLSITSNSETGADGFGCCERHVQVTQNDLSVTYYAGEDNCSKSDNPTSFIPEWLTYISPAAFVNKLGANLLANTTLGQNFEAALGGVHYDCKHFARVEDESGNELPSDSQKGNLLYYMCEDTNDGAIFGRCAEDATTGRNDKGWKMGTWSGFVLCTNGWGKCSESLGTESQYNVDSSCYYDNTVAGGTQRDDTQPDATKGYKKGCNALLAPLPGLDKVDESVSLGQYINTIIRVAIGILTAAAVVALVIVGIQYMTVGSVTGKDVAKGRIRNILLGLLLALGAFTILFTINPNLINLQPNIEEVTINDTGSFSTSQYTTDGDADKGYCKALDDALLNGKQFGNDAKNNPARLEALVQKDAGGNSGFFKIQDSKYFAPAKKQAVIDLMKATLASGSGPFATDPLKTKLAEYTYQAAKSYNINPFYVLKQWKIEGGGGPASAGVSAVTYNFGNLIATSSWNGKIYTSQSSGLDFRDYKATYAGDLSWQTAVNDYLNNYQSRYLSIKQDTVEEIVPRYAPCSVITTKGKTHSDNTLQYINDLKSDINKASQLGL